ncbi:hypothetical protein SJ938_13245, partial [Enterococcus faecium]
HMPDVFVTNLLIKFHLLSSADLGGCNPTARSLRDRSFVFSSVGLTHRKRLVELWLLFKIH